MSLINGCYKCTNTEIPTNLIVKELVFNYLGSLDADSYLTDSIIKMAKDASDRANDVVDVVEGLITTVNDKVSAVEISQDNTIQRVDNFIATDVTPIVNDAINSTVIEGSVITDTLVTVTSNGSGTIVRTQRAKNNERLTPFDFGAIGDGKHHPLSERFSTLADAQEVYPHVDSLDDSLDWAAIQAFFNYCDVNLVVDANYSINASVNKTVEYTSENQKTKVFNGHLRLRASSEMPELLLFRGVGLQFNGQIELLGFSDSKFTGTLSKRVPIGLRIAGSDGSLNNGERMYIRSVIASGFGFFGVYCAQSSMFAQIDFLRGISNGSGYFSSYTSTDKNAHSASFTDRVDLSTTSDTSQSTTIKVSSLPMTSIGNININIGGELYNVLSMDRDNSTLRVYPNIDHNVTTGNLVYQYGGAVHVTGNNSGCTRFGTVQAILCGSAFSANALYGATVQTLIAEYCGVGVILSSRWDSGTMGYVFTNSYFEANKFDYIQMWGSLYELVNFIMTEGINLNKIYSLSGYRLKSSNRIREFNTGLTEGTKIAIKGKVYQPLKRVYNENQYQGKFLVPIEDNNTHNTVFLHNSPLIYPSINTRLNELFGYDSREVTILGTSIETQAPSKVSFIAPTGWTVNGHSQFEVTGFGSAVSIKIFAKISSKTFYIACLADRVSSAVPTSGWFRAGQIVTSTSSNSIGWVANNSGFACNREWVTPGAIGTGYYFSGSSVYLVHTGGNMDNALASTKNKGEKITDSSGVVYEYMGNLVTFSPIPTSPVELP